MSQLPLSLRSIDDETAVLGCFWLMRQLRPQLASEAEFLERWRRQVANGYRMDGLFDGSEAVALAGPRIGVSPRAGASNILTAGGIDMLATKLRTPLPAQLHLTLALEAGYQTGEKPVMAQLVETVLSRHDHRLKDMTGQFDTKAAEIRAMFSNQLEPKRTTEILERMLAAG